MHQTTVRQCLQLAQNKIDRLDAELLLAHTLGKNREFVLANNDYKIGRLKDWKIKRLFKKRAKGVPLAYLTGHKEFFGLDFFVNKDVLIPRPDTELMVLLALDKIERLKDYKITLIDVGTGSGCIPIAIAKTIRKSGLSVIRNFFAVDISKKALGIARKNAKKHDVKIDFLHGTLLSPFINLKPKQPKTQNLIITANLPYITEEQFQSEPSIHHEPKLALIAEDQGLALYRELLEQMVQLTAYGLRLTAFFEIDPSQSTTIKPLSKNTSLKLKLK
jgi:release factor glutamine methyltransferase